MAGRLSLTGAGHGAGKRELAWMKAVVRGGVKYENLQ